jgi:hypothetical protein
LQHKKIRRTISGHTDSPEEALSFLKSSTSCWWRQKAPFLTSVYFNKTTRRFIIILINVYFIQNDHKNRRISSSYSPPREPEISLLKFCSGGLCASHSLRLRPSPLLHGAVPFDKLHILMHDCKICRKCVTTTMNSPATVVACKLSEQLKRCPLVCLYSSVQDWLIDWLFMMRWDYVSELRPPTGLLFIPRVNMSMDSHGDDYAGWR